MSHPLHLPYPSRRTPIFARRGMVATSNPLAAQAGLRVLQEGGNAIDAAVATAAALTIVEPTSNGIGSDAFAILWANGQLYGLNSSGPAPAALTLDLVKRAGHQTMPAHGLLPITVPGAPAAWQALVTRFGRRTLADDLAPAIRYAEEGYPLAAGQNWKRAAQFYGSYGKPEFAAWFDTFTDNGRTPLPGEIWRLPDHARTLAEIAETGAESFYRGRLADRIAEVFRLHGGYLSESDLGAFEPEWIDPISVSYRGHQIYEIPPNGQGLVALIALAILAGESRIGPRDSAETYHLQIEALKLAFADGFAHIADPRRVPVPVAQLLSPAYAESRRREIGEEALDPAPGELPSGGTVYLATADSDGNMVSFIQSNYMGFGSGVVVPGTGIALQNRGHGFSLDPEHPNRLEPKKRPFHTIIPGFVAKDGQPVGPFGVMGGHMQPQGHLQVIMNLLDFGLNPQAALDAPRWQWVRGREVELEYGTAEHIGLGLVRRGHQARWAMGHGLFGNGQIIQRLPNGVLVGGTEPRTDGQIAAW
jgi:gamma-glutamyltranspeptidase/glutathione hydrolase